MARRGGDKLFKKAKEKKDYARQKPNKELVKSIIIACEDSVSSPIYFQMIIDKLIDSKKITPNSIIIVPHDGHTDPMGVLNNLKQYKKSGLTYKDFEHKWIVIDRDRHRTNGGGHTAENFNNAIRSAENLLRSYKEEHNPETDNPSTTVHKLVILLNMLNKTYQRSQLLSADWNKSEI